MPQLPATNAAHLNDNCRGHVPISQHSSGAHAAAWSPQCTLQMESKCLKDFRILFLAAGTVDDFPGFLDASGEYGLPLLQATDCHDP